MCFLLNLSKTTPLSGKYFNLPPSQILFLSLTPTEQLREHGDQLLQDPHFAGITGSVRLSVRLSIN